MIGALERRQSWLSEYLQEEEGEDPLDLPAHTFSTEKIQSLGVILCFSDRVGDNHKRKINPLECAGVVLFDKRAPFMFINSKDNRGHQLFTLFFELAHLFIGKSAGFDQNLPYDAPCGVFCY